jgi:acetyl esterase
MTRRSFARARVAVLLVATVALSGCTAPQPDTQPTSPTTGSSPAHKGIEFIDDVDFGAPEGVRLDVCLPVDAASKAYPAIISVHGGGWSQGDKAQPTWRDSCAWLASEGFVVFQTNYRLAPEHPFPAGLDDVSAAVEWIRADAQVDRFGYDPARIGAFGDSAGGNLVALLATRGEGENTGGTRVSAVVELSAPLDLTREGIALGDLDAGFQQVQLDYLGCASYDNCAVARDASPFYQVDATDPPFYIVHASEEFIPVEQADAFVELLEADGVDVTYERVDSSGHALDLLTDEIRAHIGQWLRDRLAD